jgi:hypothetical protein
VIPLLVYVIVLLVLFGVVWWAITQMPLPHPFGIAAQVLLLVVFVLILLSLLFGAGPGTHGYIRLP